MATAQETEEKGKFLPQSYEERIYDAVNGLSALRRFFASAEGVTFQPWEQDGIAWILDRIISELQDTALNCENGRRA